MNIDLPDDPALAFKQGWAEAVDEIAHTFKNEYGEDYGLFNLDEILGIIFRHRDVQAAIAAIQDREKVRPHND